MVSIEVKKSHEENDEPYPVSKFYSVKDGFTISKSDTRWSAILIVEAEGRIQTRFYGWVKRKGIWKVDLCRFELDWDIDAVARKVKELDQKWGIGNPPKAKVQQRERRDLKDFIRPAQMSPDCVNVEW
ncbi:MAG: hypothetical protein HYY22_09110 [Thaumarchaeota archaeon]|nr:hypothetical protein [Nitrososphaerota archaeon]